MTLQTGNGGYKTRAGWYAALILLANNLIAAHLVRDFSAWTEDWESKTPESVFYSEYPELAVIDVFAIVYEYDEDDDR